MRRVGVLLSGCGIYDGSEIQETVLLALALERRGMRPVFVAPQGDQADVVDHSTAGAVEGAPARGVLEESARLARGAIRPIREIAAGELDAAVVPGGIGTLKNLCVAAPGRIGGGPLRPEVSALLGDLARRKAPIAVLGLAEAVLAKQEGRSVSAATIAVPAGEVVVDEERRTLFTPGFMATDDLLTVAEGIERLADRLAGWLGVGEALRVRRAPPQHGDLQ